MKICPKCQQQYPNGFQYCPNDTEALITNEEHIRRTKPLSAQTSQPIGTPRAETPAVEFVPITNPFPPEKTEVLTPSKTSLMTEVIGQESTATQPRQSEPARPAPQAPRKVAETPQVSTQAQTKKSTPSNPVTNSVAPAQSAFGGFSIPEEPSLIARLTAGLQNIGEVFKKSDYKATGDFQFLLQEESLGARVQREIGMAVTDFRRNPKQFTLDVLRGEGSNQFRRNAFLAGFEMVIVAVFTLLIVDLCSSALKKAFIPWTKPLMISIMAYTVFFLLVRSFLLIKMLRTLGKKLPTFKVSLEFVNWVPLIALLISAIIYSSNYNYYCGIFPAKCEPPEEKQEEPLVDVAMVDLSKMDVKLPESAKAKEKLIGGSKSQPKPASGGGGGGRNQPTPPSKGVPPQMALTPQIIPPDPNPPKIKNPTLVVASTLYGDPKAMPPMKGPIGDPDGVPAPPSSGPGSGAGIGRGTGTGVGGGGGGGLGPGQGGNTGGGNMGIGGGGGVQPMTASLKPTILYKERAKYTEDARANKIQGAVVVELTYTADGRITDVKVIRGLPDGLTESAIESAKKIRFQPAMKNGQPVSVRGRLEFNFTLY